MSDLNKSSARKLIYEGSVKRLWQCPDDEDKLWFEFTDDYSIFDWGKMPDTIENKGRALAFLGAHFFKVLSDPSFWQEMRDSKEMKRFGGEWLTRRFNHPVYEQLASQGLGHHFTKLSDGKNAVAETAVSSADRLFMEVLKADVPTPEHRKILNHELYFYPHTSDQNIRYKRRLIPLEIVFRFGMPEGSSLTARLEKNPGYLKELGLPAKPSPGQWFPVPVIEFFTKLEPADRLLSWTEACQVSGLTGETFENLLETTLDCALALHKLFAEKGLELWDGKFEFVVEYPENGKPRILLADSIGPDELRLIYRGHHLSKELIRQIYRDTNWAGALEKAKNLAKQRLEADFKRICLEELGEQPAPLQGQEKQIVNTLYGSIANTIAADEIFPGHPTLEEFVEKLNETFSPNKQEVHDTKSDTKQGRRRLEGARTAIHKEQEISVKPRGDKH